MSFATVKPQRLSRVNGWLLAALALGAVLVALNWVGYDGADDRSYALGAEAWLRHFPAVGTDHWATRHTVVLPVALSLAIFGRHEFALAIPSVLYFFAFLLVNHHFATRFLGAGAAALLAMLLAATPAFVVQASYINIDIAEAFFASLSFWLFAVGAKDNRASMLFWSGAAAGLAFLTRETSAVLPIFFAVCFLFDKAPARKSYLYLALGFVATVGVELVYFWIMTGDLLYRYRMDAHHDAVSRVKELQHTAKTGGTLDRQGNLSVSVWADPFLLLFASQKYGLLFWFAIPASVWAFRMRAVGSFVVKRAGRLMPLWIAFLSLAFPILYLVPRYYIVPAWAGVLLIAYTAHTLWPTGRRRVAVAAAIAALVAVNALSLYVENTNPRFAEHALAAWLKQNPGTTVHVDPDMARRSDLLMSFAGLDGRVVAGTPQAGDLFVFSPRNLQLCKEQGQCKGKLYQPQAGWTKIAAIKGRPRAIGGLLRAVRLSPLIPHQIMQKIETPAPGITIYRVR